MGNTDHTSLVVGVTTLVTCGATIYIVIALFRWVTCINILYCILCNVKCKVLRLNSFSQESNTTKTRLVKINITNKVKCQNEVLNDNSQ